MQVTGELPHLHPAPFLTDGGLETTLIFHRGLKLPEFAAFTLLADEKGRDELRHYYEPYIELARRFGTGFVLESPTWRASPGWAPALGYSESELDQANHAAIDLMVELRDANPDVRPMPISGCIGPQGDGYNPQEILSAAGAEEYHSTQIGTFGDTAADLVTAVTMTYAEEAIGIVRAAAVHDLPAVISFTVETDGRLPSEEPLGEAIERTDAETGAGAAYFMINCAHPTHFAETLENGGEWRNRIRGLRANASRMSHQELDEAPELDDGDPEDLGSRYEGLRATLPMLNVLGGCCGTDHRHIEAIGEQWPLRASGR